MKTSIRKIGTSQGVLIPKLLLAKAGMLVGDDDIDIDVEGKEIVIRKLKKSMRQGWAEASRKIAVAQDDAMVWPQFEHQADMELIW